MWRELIPVLIGSLFVAAALIGVLGMLIFELAERRRRRRLSASDPPSAQELEQAQRLRRPGVVQLRARHSVAAHRLEAADEKSPLSRYGGGRAADSQSTESVLERWLDR